MYGNDESSLAAQVRAEGVDEYAVMRTTLEDVYLALTQATRERTDADGAS